MKPLVIDTESTGATNGTNANPYTASNCLCFIGAGDGEFHSFKIEYDKFPYGGRLGEFTNILSRADLLIGFNLKHDLAWIRRYGVVLPTCSLWDCQSVQFVLNKQRTPWLSLDEVANFYGVGKKIDLIKTKYWNNGIDTDQIPENELLEYLEQDVSLTTDIFIEQFKIYQSLPEDERALIDLVNEDSWVLHEMEWNGLYYDFELAKENNKKIEDQVTEIDRTLYDLHGYSFLSHTSRHHLSALLYGGLVTEKVRESYDRILKDGTVKRRERWGIKETILSRLVEPLDGTLNKDKKTYSTEESVLRKLRAKGVAKRVISLLLERAKLEKLRSTYFEGFIDLNKKMEWEPNVLHGQFNQCVAVTGRLASKQPNEQNLPDLSRKCVVSRWK